MELAAPSLLAPPAAGAASAATGPGAARPGFPGAGATPPGPPPFATLIKDARRFEGALTLWQKEDKVWIELAPEQLGQPFLLSPKIRNGIGEAGILGGLMIFDDVNGAGGPQVVEFVRVHNTVRLQARNTDVRARPGTPEALAVAASYSNSLLAVAPVASAPHPDRKSVLIEANLLFLNDLMGISQRLSRGLRGSWSLDRSNSSISAVRATPQAVVLETQNHFAGGGSGPQMLSLPGMPTPLLQPLAGPRFLPDARSMLVGLNYSLAPLPAEPMAARPADPRVGLFMTTTLDFSDDLQRTPRQRAVHRWRLEKKDPTAEMSPPVKPITFWIDRNVPLAYRDTVREAILEWNKAFERIGFQEALVVKQQPDDATFDTLDFGVASVRWMMNAEPMFSAIGPSHVDPRSGEILDADIAFEGMAARRVRGERAQVLPAAALAALTGAAVGSAPNPSLSPFVAPWALPAPDATPTAEAGPAAHGALCLHAALGAEQLAYALDVLEARGEIESDSPQAQQFVLDYVKDAVMHEVGHALGLRHNFRASRIYTEAQLADPEFTRANGTTGSVMEYTPVNLPRPGERGGVPFQTTLGPYDLWAIEYAYKPMPPGTTPEAERAELQRIAARSSEPQLAFGTDEDVFGGLDPETLQLDLGSDPIAFAEKRLAIARDLFRRQETRELPPQRDYAVLRRSVQYALNDSARALGVLARQIGGVRTLRDYPGSGRDPLQPLAAEQQRRALALMIDATLAPDALAISPALQRRLAPDYLERSEGAAVTDYQFPERVLDLQRAVLAFLMSDGLARRVLDNVAKFDRPADALALGEVYSGIDRRVWAGLGRERSIPAARRELQREHLNRVALAAVRPAAMSRADARALLRNQARSLLGRLQAALRTPDLDAATRGHLEDGVQTLRLALAAPLQRLSL